MQRVMKLVQAGIPFRFDGTKISLSALELDGFKVDNGKITFQGKDVGRVDSFLKHGYHPMVEIVVGSKRKEYETDDPKLFPNKKLDNTYLISEIKSLM